MNGPDQMTGDTFVPSSSSEHILQLVIGIADDLLRALHDSDVTNLSLASGLAGQAVFFANIARFFNFPERYSKASEECLDKIAAGLRSADALQPGLFSGIAGVAWGVRETNRLLHGSFTVAAPTDFRDIYDFVFSYLSVASDIEFDLIAGLTGIGIWALTLPEADWRQRISSVVVKRLADCAVRDNGYAKWQTPASRPRSRNSTPPPKVPEFNLGVAHGLPGVIGFLARCAMQSVEVDLSRDLLNGSVRWLLNQELPSPESEGSFPYVAESPTCARLAWCYGDAGIIPILLSAATILNSRSLESATHRMMMRASRRRAPTCGVVDAGFCHGAAGLVHIFSTLADRTGSSALREAHAFWLHALLKMRTPAEGIGGYRTYITEPRPHLAAHAGFLNGASGIGLVLLSEVTGELGWSYPFLTN